jgi:hypothetical protein
MSNEPDSELEKTLSQTLDSSLARIDAETAAQLVAARRAALHQRKAWQRGAFGLATAAAVTALAILPWSGIRNHENPDVLSANDADYLPADPQLLTDMDMLSDMEMIDAIGEVTDTSTTQNEHAGDS